MTALENEVRERRKVSEKVSELADWLAKRREAIEAHVRHALLRLQSDALAYALRKAESQSEESEKVRAYSKSVNIEGCEKIPQPNVSEKASSAVLKAVKEGRANFDEAARKLERTSSEFGNWRAEVSVKVATAN